MTRTQRAIIPGMLASFWLGKTNPEFIDGVVIVLILIIIASINIYFENKY
ncbi:hypothetical protein [Marinomonas algicola]|nr:hypothetical protein [Marinomonas algicola]